MSVLKGPSYAYWWDMAVALGIDVLTDGHNLGYIWPWEWPWPLTLFRRLTGPFCVKDCHIFYSAIGVFMVEFVILVSKLQCISTAKNRFLTIMSQFQCWVDVLLPEFIHIGNHWRMQRSMLNCSIHLEIKSTFQIKEISEDISHGQIYAVMSNTGSIQWSMPCWK